jgi:hypothetical protein
MPNLSPTTLCVPFGHGCDGSTAFTFSRTSSDTVRIVPVDGCSNASVRRSCVISNVRLRASQRRGYNILGNDKAFARVDAADAFRLDSVPDFFEL